MEISEVLKFYKDTKIFVTGGTGFVGKTLIEKLLRVTEVATIYMLIREKKEKTPEERINKMFANPLFEVLKSEKPDYRSKVKAVIGEFGASGLIISDLDKEELKANINIIFHSAATLKFTLDIKKAYGLNVKATKTILDLAKEIQGLKAMVYISTAFSNCRSDIIYIEEKVYDYQFDDAIAKIEETSKKHISSKKIIGKWPNTYTFTKAIAELLIKKEGKDLPVGIFRPSLIGATYKEPIPGWLDNINGLHGVAIGVMTGILRVIFSKMNNILDAVPVDKCVSALAVTPWDIAEMRKTQKNENIPVYNFTSGNENPFTAGYWKHLFFSNLVPSSQIIWYPCIVIVSNYILFWIISIVLEIIPALFMDALAVVTWRKPRLVSIYIKVLRFKTALNSFELIDWQWDNRNVQNMWKKINKVDQEIFPFSMASFSWLIFNKSLLLGVRRYILKEDDVTLPQAYAKYRRGKYSIAGVLAAAEDLDSLDFAPFLPNRDLLSDVPWTSVELWLDILDVH